jgi:molecular chaperone GrpE
LTTEDRDVSPVEEGAEVEDTQGGQDVESSLSALEEKAEKYLANWQRAEADLANFRKRAEQGKADLVKFANETLILSLLPALDDLERALENASEELAGTTFVEGIELIQRKLQAALQAQGLSAIEAEGKDFDPNLHEAVMCVEGEEGKVVEELQKGYKFRDRVIRPSMVKVGKEGGGAGPGDGR